MTKQELIAKTSMEYLDAWKKSEEAHWHAEKVRAYLLGLLGITEDEVKDSASWDEVLAKSKEHDPA